MRASVISFTNWENQNIALSAVAQCAALVHELAVGREIKQTHLAGVINPLLILNPESVEQLYPNLEDLTLGFSTIESILGADKKQRNSQIRRYISEILILRKSFSDNIQMQERVRVGLRKVEPIKLTTIDTPIPHEELNEQNNTFEEISSLYRVTLSTLKHHIRVAGKIQFLKNEVISNKIRGLLFAGVRSAVLWHQLNGRYWRFFVFSKRIRKTVSNIHYDIVNDTK